MNKPILPDPAGDLEHGPAADWRPGAHHLLKIVAWTRFLQQMNIPKDKASAWAFELWKIGQRVDSR